ncbi:MAG: hypothetical protein EXR45_07745 [Chloroflexi bacterium]|nr:hypothetical protein [Chloroflexota bacterium]
MTALLFALASALAWGISDFLGGYLSRRVRTVTVIALSQMCGLAAIVTACAVTGKGFPSETASMFAFGAGLTGAAGLGAFYQALSIGTISLVAPIAATGVVVPVLSGLLAGEEVGLIGIAGMFCAMAGVVLASFSNPEPHQRLSVEGQAHRASIILAILAATGFGAFFTLFHAAATEGLLEAALVQRITSVALLGTAWIIMTWRDRQSPEAPPTPGHLSPRSIRVIVGMVITGVFDMLANILYGEASVTGLLSLTSMLSSLYPVITVLLARFVLHERLGGLQHTGVGLALVGTVLISVK